MPRATANHSRNAVCARIDGLVEAANKFMATSRAEGLIRKWTARLDMRGAYSDRLMAHAADAVLLSADLLLVQPSASGETAFDRLAKSLGGKADAAKTELQALRGARFRLLRLEDTGDMREVVARDVLTDEALRVVGLDCPRLPAGMRLFARAAMLDRGVCHLAGAITPLDDAAFAVARGHAAAGATSKFAASRWAEAVYAHVVGHGTLDIAGLNRPREGFMPDAPEFEPGPILDLAMEWEALADRTPDEALLRRTQSRAYPAAMLEELAVACVARKAGSMGLATAIDRLLLAQMETLQRREQAGSGQVTMEGLARAVEDAINNGLPAIARDLFASLRQRLGNAGARRPDDSAMERLLTRIQGLRAKTVDQGCTEQEALAAAEKVAELLDRHGLSLGALDFAAQPCEGAAIQTRRRRMAPFDSCVPRIAAFFDCRVWVEAAPGSPMRYVFFGLRGDVAAARYLYEMVERAFETETNAFRAGALYRSMEGERRSASNSFQIGLARGIADKLHVLRRSRETHLRSASGRDLVPMKTALVDGELAKLGMSLHGRATGGAKRVLSDAFEAGEAAGQRFEFNAAIADAA